MSLRRLLLLVPFAFALACGDKEEEEDSGHDHEDHEDHEDHDHEDE